MKKMCIIFLMVIGLIPAILASDVLVWQGQYYTGTTFNTGTYSFNFSVYDNETGGDICYSNTTSLTTGNWGEWKTEQSGVNSACNNISKDYFLNINIGGTDQSPRRRLVIWNSLRKDANEITNGSLILHGILQGLSPLKLQDEINFIKPDGTITSALYNAPRELASTLPAAFADSLIHDIIQETNVYGMQECFWDEKTETMQMCISGAYLLGRATTISRSLQIVGNTTNKPVDEDFTLCEGNNYVDCDTDATGADLLVEDDIEAVGSIFSQENITAKYFIGDGSFLTGIKSYGEIYNSTAGGELTLTTQNTWYNITGFSSGFNNRWYFNSTTNELICNSSGIYKVIYSITFALDAANEIEMQVTINNMLDEKSISIDSSANDAYQTSTYTYLQEYSVGDKLVMQVMNLDADGKVMTFQNRNLIVNKLN